MIVSTPNLPTSNRMHAWRRQIGHRHTLAGERGPRPFAILSFLVRGSHVEDRYVPLRQLTLMALFDERLGSGELATRLVGVGASIDNDGFHFGGIDRSRFDKDLRLAPANGRRGARLDTADGQFFEFALSLERYLERCARHPHMPRRRIPRLPVLESTDPAYETSLVDVLTLPKRQVITLASTRNDLVGRLGTTTFDFVNTRFRVAR